MDRRSWLWRKESSEMSPGETESSVGSISSHSERFSDDQVYLNQNFQSLEIGSKSDARESEHNQGVMSLSEKLEEALENINAKEELVKQHAKVAEEAVSGWEKSESEVLALRKQLEALSVRNSTLEDRIAQLDGALKECLRQLRQTREEKDQIALENKNSERESSSTSIDVDLLHKLEMREKENSNLKHELSPMAEELEIRLIERELSNKAAEQASKQLIDNVKKVAKLEAECHRLNCSLERANSHQQEARKTPSKNGRNRMESLVEIDLMDDFLEMERLVGLPESYEVEERLKKDEKEYENELMASRKRLKEVESKLAELENELKVSREQFNEAESKSGGLENELKASREQLKEVESKSGGLENELKASRERLKEVESKSGGIENELKESKKRLKEAESNLAEHENELKASRICLKEIELKLVEREKELRVSRYRLEEVESKLDDREKELKPSRKRLEWAESKLAELENELKASRYGLEESELKLAGYENELKQARTKFMERESELKISTNQLKEAESKLADTKSRLETAESGFEATYMKKEEAESRCKGLEAKLEILLTDLQKEQDLSQKAKEKCRELENEVLRLQHKVQGTRLVNSAEELRFRKAKQEKQLAMAGSKFAECQKTIASLTRQLNTLATIDDFLIDTKDS